MSNIHIRPNVYMNIIIINKKRIFEKHYLFIYFYSWYSLFYHSTLM